MRRYGIKVPTQQLQREILMTGYTRQELCDMFNISIHKLNKYVTRGQLPEDLYNKILNTRFYTKYEPRILKGGNQWFG